MHFEIRMKYNHNFTTQKKKSNENRKERNRLRYRIIKVYDFVCIFRYFDGTCNKIQRSMKVITGCSKYDMSIETTLSIHSENY